MPLLLADTVDFLPLAGDFPFFDADAADPEPKESRNRHGNRGGRRESLW